MSIRSEESKALDRDVSSTTTTRGVAARLGPAVAALAIVALVLTIYVPDMGRGFISDDHRWIAEGQVHALADVLRVFSANVGFYRPLVMLSFGLDYRMWHGWSFGYFVTNLTWLAVAALLVWRLARRLHLPSSAALIVIGVWLLNIHAVNMALLWLSGRTALLAGTLGLAAMHAVLSRRWVAAGLLAFGAMCAKEEAVMLPVLALTWSWSDREPDEATSRTSLWASWPLWVALAGYAALRARSGAFGPTGAPDYYRLTMQPAIVLRNALEYADRSGTVAAVVSVTLLAAARRLPAWTHTERRVARLGVMWMLAWFAVTIWLPIRSSLYALIPSIGAALCAGVVASAAWRTAPRAARLVATGWLVAATLAIPVYRGRNVRWTQPAALSTRVLATIATDAQQHPTGGSIVLVDDSGVRFNLRTAFGALFPVAVPFWLGSQWTGDLLESGPTPPATLRYRLRGDTLERLP